MSDAPTLERFEPHLGKACRADAAGTPFEIVLESIERASASVHPGGGFALYFRGPVSPFLPQGTYTIEIGGEDRFIFLVPLGPDDAGMRYEAIFN